MRLYFCAIEAHNAPVESVMKNLIAIAISASWLYLTTFSLTDMITSKRQPLLLMLRQNAMCRYQTTHLSESMQRLDQHEDWENSEFADALDNIQAQNLLERIGKTRQEPSLGETAGCLFLQ